MIRIRAQVSGSERLMDVLVANGRIAELCSADAWQRYDLGGSDLHLAPAFLDLQINGYGGIDWNEEGTSVEQIAAAVRQLWRTGVVALCPTVITASSDHIAHCLANLARAADCSPEVARAMAGLHLEGPYISPEDGPRGAHAREHVCPPDWDQFQRWQDAAGGRIRIITLAPEWPGALSFIERAASAGLIVALGHTAAQPEQIADAVRAGARLSTHLGNGSHAKIDRHRNYIWEQLASDELWASLIVDGHHLPPSVVKCFVRCKTVARTILVTDAIAAAGQPPGHYRLGNVAVEVTAEQRVCLPGTPYLAGSVLEMHEAIANMVRYGNVTFDEAIRMASKNPAALLGLTEQYGSLAAGRPAHLVLFHRDDSAHKLNVVAMVVSGELVYQNDALLN